MSHWLNQKQASANNRGKTNSHFINDIGLLHTHFKEKRISPQQHVVHSCNRTIPPATQQGCDAVVSQLWRTNETFVFCTTAKEQTSRSLITKTKKRSLKIYGNRCDLGVMEKPPVRWVKKNRAQRKLVRGQREMMLNDFLQGCQDG